MPSSPLRGGYDLTCKDRVAQDMDGIDKAQAVRRDMCHALASLYRRQAQYERAIAFAQQALSLREEVGDTKLKRHGLVPFSL
jgi:hypothetical protein